MQASAHVGNQLMDDSLAALYKNGRITRETAISYSIDKNYISTLL